MRQRDEEKDTNREKEDVHSPVCQNGLAQPMLCYQTQNNLWVVLGCREVNELDRSNKERKGQNAETQKDRKNALIILSGKAY